MQEPYSDHLERRQRLEAKVKHREKEVGSILEFGSLSVLSGCKPKTQGAGRQAGCARPASGEVIQFTWDLEVLVILGSVRR